MNYNYNLLNYEDNLPININFYTSNATSFEWHQDLEIIVLGKGSCSLFIKDKEYKLSDKGVILVNSCDIHKIYDLSDDALVFSIHMNPYFIDNYFKDFSKLTFDCNSIIDIDLDSNKYNKLYTHIASISLLLLYKDELRQVKLLKETFTLVEFLINNFSCSSDINYVDISIYHQRFNRILEYINANYDKKITLNDLAKKEYLTTHYISRFFNKYMGIGFIKYLNNFRLQKSIYDLVNTNKSILDIALDHGFSSIKAYRYTFIEKYNISPSVYRKEYTDSHNTNNIITTFNADIKNSIILFLQECLSNNNTNTNVNYVERSLDCINYSKKYWANFERIIFFEKACDALNFNWQKSFQSVAGLMKLDYIKFAGIFDDNIYIYDESKNLYNWYNIEIILDYFVGNHINPFLKIEYSSKKESIKAFTTKLDSFILFCLQRYGFDNIKNWNFEISSIEKDYESMIKLYTSVFEKIQNHNLLQKLSFGIDFTINENFYKDYFLKHIIHLKISFISIYVKENIFLSQKEFIKLMLIKLKRLMKVKTYIIQEMENHYLNDTCYKATQVLDYFINDYYMCDSQINFIDNFNNMSLFKGESSALTYNGLKKPIFNAFFLLNKVTGHVIECKDGYVLSKNQSSYVLLLYNHMHIENYLSSSHCDYRHLYKDVPTKAKYFNLSLSVQPGKYYFKEYTFNTKNGSIYDEWLKMGSPLISNNEIIKFLNSKEVIRLKFNQQIVDDKIEFKEYIPLNGIKLIEFNLL